MREQADFKCIEGEQEQPPHLKELIPLIAIIACALLAGTIYYISQTPMLPDEVALQDYEAGDFLEDYEIVRFRLTQKTPARNFTSSHNSQDWTTFQNEVALAVQNAESHPTLATIEVVCDENGEDVTYYCTRLFMYKNGTWIEIDTVSKRYY